MFLLELGFYDGFWFLRRNFISFFDCCFQLEQQSFSDQDIWLRGEWWSAKTLNWLSRGVIYDLFLWRGRIASSSEFCSLTLAWSSSRCVLVAMVALQSRECFRFTWVPPSF